jgi:hypothetical protein
MTRTDQTATAWPGTPEPGLNRSAEPRPSDDL